MRVDKAGRNQRPAVVVPGGLWVRGLQRGGLAHCGNAASLDQHGAMGEMARGFWPGCERVIGIA